MRAATARSLNDFGSCFTHAQERESRAWAFLPSRSGGTFTDAQSSNTAAVYWLAFNEAKPLNELRLFADAGSSNIVEAVNRCR